MMYDVAIIPWTMSKQGTYLGWGTRTGFGGTVGEFLILGSTSTKTAGSTNLPSHDEENGHIVRESDMTRRSNVWRGGSSGDTVVVHCTFVKLRSKSSAFVDGACERRVWDSRHDSSRRRDS